MPKTAWEEADPHQSPAGDGAERVSAQEEIPDHLWGALRAGYQRQGQWQHLCLVI